MNKIKILMISSLFFIISFLSFADSPITSTEFYDAYSSYKILNDSYYKDGVLNEDLMKYLDEDNPIDVKMAIINKLSWDSDRGSNSAKYFNYLSKKYDYDDEMDFIKNGSGDNLLCMAYLKAMDDYFNVEDAIWYAEMALKFKPKSYTYNIILAIIKAQKAMDYDWKEVYELTNSLRNKDLNIDMKEEARNSIYEYMDSYKE